MTTAEQREFCRAYARLAEQARCDAPDGMEYRRVLRDWQAAGCPRPLDRFIVVRANIGADGRGREVLN